MKLIPAFFIFLLLFCGSAKAGEMTTINPTDENGINEALQNGGTVYLNPGVYEIKGPIYIGSNTVLTGDKNAIIRVSSSSSQWFVEGTGIINHKDYPLKNVEICGFQIDGNIGNLPSSYANYGKGDHNAERLIYLRGNAKAFMENISVHDMELYDSYSDGIQLAYCDNAQVYNNFVSNCQHSGIFLISVRSAVIHKNDIAGITSDCLRLDNCVNNIIFDNILYSYTGDNLQGQGTNGENSLQIADEGYSHGGGSAKPTHTTNIEVYNNTFANTGLRSIWLDSTGKGVDNVYIHDNKFLKGSEFTNNGVSVEGISFTNPPTKEMSHNIFGSIFDILNQEYSFKYLDQKTEINASVDVIEYNNSYNPHSLVYVNGEFDSVKVTYSGNTSTHYFTVNNGEQVDIWSGELPYTGNAVYLKGEFNPEELQVICYNSQGYSKITDFNITEVNDNSNQILNPALWSFVGTLTILGISIFRNFRRIIKW